MSRAEFLSRANGWTGGQASLLRWLLGVGIAAGAWWGSTPWLGGLLGLVIALGAVGTRVYALVLTAILVALASWDAAPANGVPFGALRAVLTLPALALATAWVAAWPPAPFGSLAARGRPDPRGDWRLGVRFDVFWIVSALVMLSLGIGALRLAVTSDAPGAYLIASAALWIIAALLGPWRRTRPVAWSALAVLFVVTLCAGMPFVTFLPLAWFLAALFDPAWVRSVDGQLELFYDGECALCQGFTRFAIAEDREARLRFGPQSGESFREFVGERADELPDSIVVRTEAGAVLVRSLAVLRVADALGGYWRIFGWLARVVPRRIRDVAYDVVARARKRLRPPKSATGCPVVAPDLGARFLA
ncbi:MAG: DCC1-like thiol-disulfide oxidoreductase family protein [Planctomycetota bacterium]